LDTGDTQSVTASIRACSIRYAEVSLQWDDRKSAIKGAGWLGYSLAAMAPF